MFVKSGYILIEAMLLFYICTMIIVILTTLCTGLGHMKIKQNTLVEIRYEAEIKEIYESYQNEE